MLRAVRYGLPIAIFVAGVVVLIIEPNGGGLGAFFAFTGAALSVLLLNILFRAGVRGDREREQEEEARAFYDRFGRWPDEDPPRRRPPT
jgi:hypothetical protein